MNLALKLMCAGFLLGDLLAETNGMAVPVEAPRIATKQTVPATVIFLSNTGPYWMTGTTLHRIAEFMREHGETGAMYVRFERDPTGANAASLQAEVGFFATREQHAPPPFQQTTRDSELVAFAIVDPSASTPMRHHRALIEWAEHHGFSPSGPVTEIYHPLRSLAVIQANFS